MKTMMIAAVAGTLALGVGSTAYADGSGGATATGMRWRAENGDATVPATQWFGADSAQRQRMSHQYAGATLPAYGANRG